MQPPERLSATGSGLKDAMMDSVNELKLLLPFYVNGTLDAEGCARIDAGLAAHAELRAELTIINELAQTIKEGGTQMTQDTTPTAEPAARPAEVRPAPVYAAATAPAAQPVASFLAFLNPRKWHPAVSLSLAVAALAQAGMISGLNGDKAQGEAQVATLEKRVGELQFQLASGPGGGETLKADILLQVRDTASWAALSALLASEELTIIDGPGDNTLSLSSPLDGAALEATIKRLRASPLIAAADKAA